MSHVCDRCNDERTGCCVELDNIASRPPTITLSDINRVITAAHHSYIKHGNMTPDPVRAAGILCEEAGEVMAEALKMTNPTGTGSHRGAAGTPEAMMWELAQTAATALAIIHVLEEKCHPRS